MRFLSVLFFLLLSHTVCLGVLSKSDPYKCEILEDRCQLSFKFDAGVISWYVVSQMEQVFELTVKEVGSGKIVVNTSVYSTDFSNASFGKFEVPTSSIYDVIIKNVSLVEYNKVDLEVSPLKPLTSTYQFAGSSITGNELGDFFGLITWFKRDNNVVP